MLTSRYKCKLLKTLKLVTNLKKLHFDPKKWIYPWKAKIFNKRSLRYEEKHETWATRYDSPIWAIVQKIVMQSEGIIIHINKVQSIGDLESAQ